MQTLLFKESPIVSSILIIALLLSYYKNKKWLVILSLVLILFLVLFYRYTPHTERYNNQTIISPAEGKITNIEQRENRVFISIFISPLNNHTQIYPINGTVTSVKYDNTGKFDIVVDMDKSRHNEKVIHTIKANNGRIVTLTQIAGFLPRRISYSKKVPNNVKAGEYLGMIKFGSRIDISFPGNLDNLKVRLNDNIYIGDIIYLYTSYLYNLNMKYIKTADNIIIILIILSLIFIIIGHQYRDKIQTPLKKPIIHISEFDLDWWSVSHFSLFAMFGFLKPGYAFSFLL